jgi:hypothetical protein
MATATKDKMKLAEAYGPVLTGRASAARIVDSVLERLARGERVEIDFTSVQAVSPSFADELFGKLTTRVGNDRVKFTNLSAHLLSVARMAEQQRRVSDNG